MATPSPSLPSLFPLLFPPLLLLLLLPLPPLSSPSPSSPSPSELLILTAEGPILGSRLPASPPLFANAFLGIPYARPPLGALRFRPPIPARPWSLPLDASSHPNACVQSVDTMFPGFSDAEMWNPNRDMSEDCLYLNVWTPSPRPPRPIPVLVWIYGGGFYSGAASLDVYDGRVLAASQSVVVVSMNYRVGALGFLAVPGYPDAPGNAGLWDQRLALGWIQRNIRAFGGDPDAVTLFGESAGAASIGIHLLSPGSRPLFHRAVLQSGSPNGPWATVGPAEGRRRALALGAALGCVGNDSEVVACLREQPAARLVQWEGSVLPQESIFRFAFVPVVDGDFLRDSPEVLLRDDVGSRDAGYGRRDGTQGAVRGADARVPREDAGKRGAGRGADGGTQGAIHGGNQGAIHGGNQGAIHGGTQGAIHGGTQGSIHGGTQGSIHGGNQRSIHGGTHSGTQDSIHGGTQGSIHGGTQDSIHGGTQGSIHSGTQDSVHSGTQRSIHGGTHSGLQDSIHSGTQRSIHSGTQDSIHSGTQRSIHSGTQDSIHGGTQDSIHSGTQGSIHSGTQDSIHSGTQRSIHGGTQGSIHGGTHGGPQDSIHATEVNGGIDILLGAVQDEGTYFLVYGVPGFGKDNESLISRDEFLHGVRMGVPQGNEVVAAAVELQYTDWLDQENPVKNREALGAIVGDHNVVCPMMEFARRWAEGGRGRVYAYLFEHRASTLLWPQWMGVPHGYEIEFVFGQPLRPGWNYTEEEKRLSRRMMGYWGNFARTGDPKGGSEEEEEEEAGGGGARWPPFTARGQGYARISTEPLSQGRGLRAQACAFWNRFLPKLLHATGPMEEAERQWRQEFHRWSSYMGRWQSHFEHYSRMEPCQQL